MTAIACILTAGFMTVAPFVQTAYAHGDSHEYTVTVYEIRVYTCTECSSVIWYEILNTYTETRTHPDGGGHSMTSIKIVENIPCGLCDDCEESSS